MGVCSRSRSIFAGNEAQQPNPLLPQVQEVLAALCRDLVQPAGPQEEPRVARDKKAALVAPRPVAGSVRPVVHGSTVKYNSKVRIGRGFSLAEIKDAGLGKLEAQSLGVAVDPRRRNR